MLLGIGLMATAVCAAGLVWLGASGRSAGRWPRYGNAGLIALVVLELLLALRVPVVETFFTAAVWTAYIVAVDAAVRRRRGNSLLGHPGAFAALALLSIPGWLIFEAYNLRLRNWAYVGVPDNFWVFILGAAWAFATIYPGIFETADLIHASWTASWRTRPWLRRRRLERDLFVLGVACLIIPLALPAAWAAYSFALVWAGLIFLLEPLQRRRGWPSLLGDLERGEPGRVAALLLAGAVCGVFWEFWNYRAAARWEYIFPILHRYRIFAMPVPGFLGFPPFAMECFATYVVLSQCLLPPALRADPLPAPIMLA
ncbi:MAG: hypothetical protein ACRD2D_14570 [Terriglobales bacterium]